MILPDRVLSQVWQSLVLAGLFDVVFDSWACKSGVGFLVAVCLGSVRLGFSGLFGLFGSIKDNSFPEAERYLKQNVEKKGELRVIISTPEGFKSPSPL